MANLKIEEKWIRVGQDSDGDWIVCHEDDDNNWWVRWEANTHKGSCEHKDSYFGIAMKALTLAKEALAAAEIELRGLRAMRFVQSVRNQELGQ